ncbi:gamma-glutamyl-gamma-aminobutyrate hydrolase family protein [Hyphobacterium sp.]|uniref:gamma-glutamyl-gamma-aminobutyrate hydrolase family protein n=1 Tax=Hyphobacterium sp. TaxID=2004662 RepID=UPI003BABA6DD
MTLSEKHRRSPSDVDGLVFSGGLDLNPSLYDTDPDPHTAYDDGRDEFEMAWAKRGWESGLPMLGICRGAQLMNVSRGGDLIQVVDEENASHYPNGPIGYTLFRKDIEVKPKTRLLSIFRRHQVKVNSLHRQAVNRAGDGLKVSACEIGGGGVQAIEAEDNRFVVGVQFHPELLIYRRDMMRLFSALVDASRLLPTPA